MLFKHPQLLYALLLLLIPILIHLFQLRRFKKVAFTNVEFLKKATLQTRKSSQIKKWVTLLLRMLALACIILAFAQPYIASKTALKTNKETVLYLDNSHSLEAKGNRGPLLQNAVKDLFEDASSVKSISWFTNDAEYKNVSLQDFKNEILSVGFSNKQRTLDEVLLKASQLFSKDKSADKQLFIVSDFQENGNLPSIPSNINVNAIPLTTVETTNIGIDSVYVSKKTRSTTQLKVKLTSYGEVPGNAISISLYNGQTLVAKTAVTFDNNLQSELTIDVETQGGFNGRLEVNDSSLTFDNTFYFSISAPSKIKVLALNETDSSYLERIFTTEEFLFTQQSYGNIDYNSISNQNLIIVNELKSIPLSLANALSAFVTSGGSIFIVPAQDGNVSSYNALLNMLGIGNFSEKNTTEKQIAQISFDHPLFQDVFEKKVVNFQFPKVNSFYPVSSNASSALRFQDGAPFILASGTTYVSTASIENSNSNFKNSPLIVPTIYNMAQLSLQLPKLYYKVGNQTTFQVPIKLLQNEIITIKDSTSSFIPLQQTKANMVSVTTNQNPEKAGSYQIVKDKTLIQNISYNYDRKESILRYTAVDNWNDVTVYNSIEEVFDEIIKENTIKSLWKWFVIFAILFLLLEMLILKLFK